MNDLNCPVEGKNPAGALGCRAHGFYSSNYPAVSGVYSLVLRTAIKRAKTLQKHYLGKMFLPTGIRRSIKISTAMNGYSCVAELPRPQFRASTFQLARSVPERFCTLFPRSLAEIQECLNIAFIEYILFDVQQALTPIVVSKEQLERRRLLTATHESPVLKASGNIGSWTAFFKERG
ncbi:hypothetical protein CPB85DRAFT_406062 [Mucidula mucida]|nr:hypothetical protein CPB85DRAFT_406062 [Mucidula mucida]